MQEIYDMVNGNSGDLHRSITPDMRPEMGAVQNDIPQDYGPDGGAPVDGGYDFWDDGADEFRMEQGLNPDDRINDQYHQRFGDTDDMTDEDWLAMFSPGGEMYQGTSQYKQPVGTEVTPSGDEEEIYDDGSRTMHDSPQPGLRAPHEDYDQMRENLMGARNEDTLFESVTTASIAGGMTAMAGKTNHRMKPSGKPIAGSGVKKDDTAPENEEMHDEGKEWPRKQKNTGVPHFDKGRMHESFSPEDISQLIESDDDQVILHQLFNEYVNQAERASYNDFNNLAGEYGLDVTVEDFARLLNNHPGYMFVEAEDFHPQSNLVWDIHEAAEDDDDFLIEHDGVVMNGPDGDGVVNRSGMNRKSGLPSNDTDMHDMGKEWPRQHKNTTKGKLHDSKHAEASDGITTTVMQMKLGEKQKNTGGQWEQFGDGGPGKMSNTRRLQENVSTLSNHIREMVSDCAAAIQNGQQHSVTFTLQAEGLITPREYDVFTEALTDAEELLQIAGPNAVTMGMLIVNEHGDTVGDYTVPLIHVLKRGPIIHEGKILFRFPELARDYANLVAESGLTGRTMSHNWGAAVSVQTSYDQANQLFEAMRSRTGITEESEHDEEHEDHEEHDGKKKKKGQKGLPDFLKKKKGMEDDCD